MVIIIFIANRWVLYWSPIATVTNYHQFCGLKQPKFVISQFCRSEVQVSLRGFSAPGFIKNQALGRICPKLIQLVGRIHFLTVSLLAVSCGIPLASRGFSPVLTHGLYISEPETVGSFTCLESLWLLFFPTSFFCLLFCCISLTPARESSHAVRAHVIRSGPIR